MARNLEPFGVYQTTGGGLAAYDRRGVTWRVSEDEAQTIGGIVADRWAKSDREAAAT
jgi:hypothetical protein